MKKIITMMLLIAMTLSLVACGAPKAEATVNQYFTAAKKLDVEKMSKVILPSNTKDIQGTKDMMDIEKQEGYAKYFFEYLEKNAGKMSYKITEKKVDVDHAIVTVKCKYIDCGKLLQATMEEAFKIGRAHV